VSLYGTFAARQKRLVGILRRKKGRALDFSVYSIVARGGQTYDFQKDRKHLIGQGRFGHVYRAVNRNKPSDVVAVKILPPEMARNRMRRRALRLEYMAMRSLKHPNLTRVYDLVEKPLLCLVLEYVPGKDLRQIIGLKEPYTLDQKLEVFIKTMRAVEYMHKHHVFHGDLKPDNIVVNLPTVKVVDYGVCQVGRPGDSLWRRVKLSLSGAEKLQTFGASPAYMAPEQVDKKPLTCCSDIYSAGMSFIFWFSGSDFPVFPLIGLEKEGLDDRRLGNLYLKKQRELDPVTKIVIRRTLNDHKESDILPFKRPITDEFEPADEHKLRQELMRILFKMVRRDPTGKLGRRNTRERERYFYPTYYNAADVVKDLLRLQEMIQAMREKASRG